MQSCCQRDCNMPSPYSLCSISSHLGKQRWCKEMGKFVLKLGGCSCNPRLGMSLPTRGNERRPEKGMTKETEEGCAKCKFNDSPFCSAFGSLGFLFPHYVHWIKLKGFKVCWVFFTNPRDSNPCSTILHPALYRRNQVYRPRWRGPFALWLPSALGWSHRRRNRRSQCFGGYVSPPKAMGSAQQPSPELLLLLS